MNEEKILQIIPAPAGLKAHYDDKEGHNWSAPIVCLALVEDATGYRHVEPMNMYPEGSIDMIENMEMAGSFQEITFPED